MGMAKCAYCSGTGTDGQAVLRVIFAVVTGMYRCLIRRLPVHDVRVRGG